MKIILDKSPGRLSCTRKIEELSGQKVFACYQCGKCSAGCPMAESMDFLPNQVIREAQLGNEPVLMGCNAVWFCSSCLACAVRCPEGIDIARVMEAVRTLQMMEDPIKKEIHLKDPGNLPQIALISHYRKFSL